MFGFKGRNGSSPSRLSLVLVVEVLTALFAAITTAILAFFVYYLMMDHMHAPWEIPYLFAVAALTTISFVVLSIRRLFSNNAQAPQASSGIPKRLIFAGLLSLLWTIGFVSITIQLRHMVLSTSCDRTIWLTDDGVMVCRIYKGLYGSIVISKAGCLLSLIFEIRARSNARGQYVEVKGDKTPKFQDFAPYRNTQRNSDQQPLTRDSRFEPFRNSAVTDTHSTLRPEYDADSKSNRFSTSTSATLTQSPFLGGSGRKRDSLHQGGDDYQTEKELEDDVGAAMLKPSPHIGDLGEDTSYRSHE